MSMFGGGGDAGDSDSASGGDNGGSDVEGEGATPGDVAGGMAEGAIGGAAAAGAFGAAGLGPMSGAAVLGGGLAGAAGGAIAADPQTPIGEGLEEGIDNDLGTDDDGENGSDTSQSYGEGKN